MANSPENVWVVSSTMSEKQIEEEAKTYHLTVEQLRQAATTLYAVFTQYRSAERYAQQMADEGYINVHRQSASFYPKRWFPEKEQAAAAACPAGTGAAAAQDDSRSDGSSTNIPSSAVSQGSPKLLTRRSTKS